MSKPIRYVEEKKLYPYFIAADICGLVVVCMMLRYLFLNAAVLSREKQFAIWMCLPGLGLLLWITFRMIQNSRRKMSVYQELRSHGESSEGTIVETKTVEVETESNDRTERSTLEHYALIEYYDIFQNSMIQKWTPELTGIPQEKADCRVFYNEKGDFYVSFDRL